MAWCARARLARPHRREPGVLTPRVHAHSQNQTVINTVLKPVLELVAARAGLEAPIDVFGALGGTPGWRESFPPSCQLSSEWAPCALYCDEQACDQCHPNDAGYACIAQAVFERLVVAGS